MSRFTFPTDRRLYRSRKGVIWGVCRGLADYFNFRVGWVRFLAVLILLLTGIWPIAAIYIVAGLLMKPEPVIPLESEEERDFYDCYTNNRQRTLRELKRRFSTLDRRLRRMEDKVTSRDFEWEQRFNSH
jgi:phage shock protein C